MNKKGVSLILLIITVTVMLILASAIVAETFKVSDREKALKFINEMKQIETKVQEEIYKKEEDSTYQLPGIQIVANTIIGTQTYTPPLWYNVTTQDLEDMSVAGIDGEYLIDYTNCVVISKVGVEYKDVMYYRLDGIDGILSVIDVE